MDSRLTSIKLTPSVYHNDETEADLIEIKGDDEGRILGETAEEVQKFDLDFITSNGDAFVFPYLYSKAQKHQVSFGLSRDPDASREFLTTPGQEEEPTSATAG